MRYITVRVRTMNRISYEQKCDSRLQVSEYLHLLRCLSMSLKACICTQLQSNIQISTPIKGESPLKSGPDYNQKPFPPFTYIPSDPYCTGALKPICSRVDPDMTVSPVQNLIKAGTDTRLKITSFPVS